MCLAAAYKSRDSDEPFLREIAHIGLEGDFIELETLMGEKKTLRGRIAEIDFMRSRVIIEQ
ncbi:MAG: CooT family nickel-binding protein [Dehalococcoidia bacterium]